MSRLVGYASGSSLRLYAGGNGETPHLVGMLELEAELDEAHAVEITVALAELHEVAGQLVRRPRARAALEQAEPQALPRAPVAAVKGLTHNGIARRVIEYLAQHPEGVSATDARAALRLQSKQWSNATFQAKQKGRIRRTGGRWYVSGPP